jgi:hypothetical protein
MQWMIYTCLGLVFCTFLMALYACRRVAINEKALGALDWETLADLTGQVAALKRSVQKTNSRMNGMTSSDPMSILNELPKLHAVQQTQSNGVKGG